MSTIIHGVADESSPTFLKIIHGACKNEKIFNRTISYVFNGTTVDINQNVKPYEILKLANTASSLEIKASFREMIRITDRKQRALVNLAYTMVMAHVNKMLPTYFRVVDNGIPSFSYNAASILVWVSVGFYPALRVVLDINRSIKDTVSLISESLLYLASRSNMEDIVELLFDHGCEVNNVKCGSTALHAAAWFSHTSIQLYLIQRGADPMQKKKTDTTTPLDEAPTEAMKTAMTAAATQSVPTFIRKVLGAEGMGEVQHLRYQNKIIGYRMAKFMDDKLRQDIHQNWYVAWHGTREKHILSIIKFGLKKPGQPVGGAKVEVPDGHIKTGVQVFGVENWSDAIFVTKCVPYACSDVYSDRIAGAGKGFAVLVEAGVCPGTYSEHGSTTPSFKSTDPTKKFEMRVDADMPVARVEKSENVKVTAITLLSVDFVENNTHAALDEDDFHALLRGNLLAGAGAGTALSSSLVWSPATTGSAPKVISSPAAPNQPQPLSTLSTLSNKHKSVSTTVTKRPKTASASTPSAAVVPPKKTFVWRDSNFDTVTNKAQWDALSKKYGDRVNLVGVATNAAAFHAIDAVSNKATVFVASNRGEDGAGFIQECRASHGVRTPALVFCGTTAGWVPMADVEIQVAAGALDKFIESKIL